MMIADHHTTPDRDAADVYRLGYGAPARPRRARSRVIRLRLCEPLTLTRPTAAQTPTISRYTASVAPPRNHTRGRGVNSTKLTSRFSFSGPFLGRPPVSSPKQLRAKPRYPAHVLAARDVLERGRQLRTALAFDRIHQSLVLVVDYHRHEATLPSWRFPMSGRNFVWNPNQRPSAEQPFCSHCTISAGSIES